MTIDWKYPSEEVVKAERSGYDKGFEAGCMKGSESRESEIDDLKTSCAQLREDMGRLKITLRILWDSTSVEEGNTRRVAEQYRECCISLKEKERQLEEVIREKDAYKSEVERRRYRMIDPGSSEVIIEGIAVEGVPEFELVECEGCNAAWKALRVLVRKLHEVHGAPEYEAVWAGNQAHFGEYKGPNYIKELGDADSLLAQCEETSVSVEAEKQVIEVSDG